MDVLKLRSYIQKFIKKKIPRPILAGILSGLYPVFFYASNNFTLINTWEHLRFFILTFIVLPVVIIYVSYLIARNIANAKYVYFTITFLGIFIFIFLMHISYYGTIKVKLSIALFLIAFIAAYFLKKNLNKVLIIQIVLAILGFISFLPRLSEAIIYNKNWTEVTTDISNAQFKKTPNIYLIQPDGYVNYSELYRGYYKRKDSTFQKYLLESGFKTYPEFRSNYASTLTSNSSTFMMKHHYYNNNLSFENYNARNIIVSKNTVLDILKNNNYKTHLLTELPYLLLNRPEMGYDFCNISYDEVNFVSTGYGDKKSTLKSLKQQTKIRSKRPNFFFIEIFNPGHIHGSAKESLGIEGEHDMWMEDILEAENKIKKHVNYIKSVDSNALIIIMADHGGFVGLEYTQQANSKIQNRDLLYSIFSANLSIYWPESMRSQDLTFKTSVNFFRILVAYLSENNKILQEQEKDASYAIIKDGAPKGVYEVINAEGEVTFIKK